MPWSIRDCCVKFEFTIPDFRRSVSGIVIAIKKNHRPCYSPQDGLITFRYTGEVMDASPDSTDRHIR